MENLLVPLAFGVLLFIVVFQFMTIQKLVDKLMSRNLYEYKSAVSVPEKVKIQSHQEQGVPDDLRSLGEYGLS